VATQWLRNTLSFAGVAVADDLHMRAIKDHYSPEEAILLALNAGCDMLIFGNNIGAFEENLTEKNIHIIKRLLSKNYVSEARLWEAYQRIVTLKQSHQQAVPSS
jgi:beta-N-acetylhexosaminidase